MAKYERRGWPLVDWSPLPELRAARRVGDSKTWVIPFEVLPPPSPNVRRPSSVQGIRFAIGEQCVVLLKKSGAGDTLVESSRVE